MTSIHVTRHKIIILLEAQPNITLVLRLVSVDLLLSLSLSLSHQIFANPWDVDRGMPERGVALRSISTIPMVWVSNFKFPVGARYQFGTMAYVVDHEGNLAPARLEVSAQITIDILKNLKAHVQAYTSPYATHMERGSFRDLYSSFVGQTQTKLDSLIEMLSRLHLDGSNTFAADTDERSSMDYNHEAGFITCSNSEDDYPVIWENPTWTTTSSLKCSAGLAEGETMMHPTIAPR
jgi:hypothetical protein